MKKIMMNLQLFAENPTPEDSIVTPAPTTVSAPAAPEIDYDKLAHIVQGKQTIAEDTVLRGYFKQQGLSKEDADKAITDFKEKQKENDPSKKALELQAKLDQYENEKLLMKKHVKEDDFEYVIFKASNISKEKNLSFEKAVDSFLKENPRFTNGGSSYRVVDTGTQSGGSGTSANSNDFINAAIRRAAGKEI